jgi:hypothetical protein
MGAKGQLNARGGPAAVAPAVAHENRLRRLDGGRPAWRFGRSRRRKLRRPIEEGAARALAEAARRIRDKLSKEMSERPAR